MKEKKIIPGHRFKKVKAMKDGVKQSKKTAAEKKAFDTNAVPTNIPKGGVKAEWKSPDPPFDGAVGVKMSGTVRHPFIREIRLKEWEDRKEAMKEAKAEAATPIAISAIRMSVEMLDEAYKKFEKKVVNSEKTNIQAVLDYMEWVYTQGIANMDAADVLRWDRRANDRLQSAELYTLCMMARYLNMTFIELITPEKKDDEG